MTYDKVSNVIVKSEKDIAQESYDKVVSSTELIELSASIVFICALIMLMNYVFLILNEKRQDYVKLRAIGLTSNSSNFIFVFHFLQAIVFAIIFAIPLAGVLSEAGGNILMSPYYYPNGISYPINLIIFEVLVLVILPTLFFTIFIRDTNKQVVLLLRSMVEE